MDFKLVGSILLIVGTSIGAGMLALPIATAELGFIGSLILLFVCWFVMTAGALCLLEANLWLPLNSNVISMAKSTLGIGGQIIAWIVYFLLLYSLLCAYIGGGSDLFHNLLMLRGLDIPQWSSAVIFTLIFGLIVFTGIRSVDYVNRGLMFVKFTAYFLLLFFMMPHVELPKLATGDLKYITSATAIAVTIGSFGYSTIIPSLRIYFNGDVAKLKKAIFIGSLIPLICYILWDMIIMGVIPLAGDHGLISIMHSNNSTSDLVNTMNAATNSSAIPLFVKVFTSVCVLTSFLGVSLCMVDFLADGLQLEKKGSSNLFIHLAAFVPPLVIVLFFPNIFVRAIAYAGIYSMILLILLPAIMVWRGRYSLNIANGYRVMGGKPLLIGLILLSLAMVIWSLV